MQGSNAHHEAASPVDVLLTSHHNSDEVIETAVGSFQVVKTNGRAIVPESELRQIARSVKSIVPSAIVPSTKVNSKY